MDTIWPFIVIGLTSGAVYGFAGVGLVLTFKTSGIFNFAHGSVAALSAFLYYELADLQGMPWAFAFVVAGLVCPAILGLLFEVLSRSLTSASTTAKVMATIGVVLTVLSIGTLWFDGKPQVVAPFLPTDTVELGGVFVGMDQIIIVGFSVAATMLLYAFFRLSRLGISMRAVVEDPELLARTGTSPTQTRRWAWVIGTSFAGVSGIALAPTIGLEPLVLTMLVVQAFGAAAVGAFSSLPLTYLGGLLIGVVSALATRYTAEHPSLGGLPSAIPFIVLFVVLVCTPRRKLVERTKKAVAPLRNEWRAPTPARALGFAIVVAVLAAAPAYAGTHDSAYAQVLTMVILISSLGLLVNTSGQVSLGQIGFAAVGAAAMAHIMNNTGIPWLVAVLFAGLIACVVGAIVAISAIRLTGVFLAIATLAFGILLEQLIYPLDFMFRVDQTGIPTPRPSGGIGSWDFSSDWGYYYILLLFVIGVVLFLELLATRPLGRLLRAMSDSPVALQTQGNSNRVTLLLVFVISAFLAAVSGALTASHVQYAVGSDFASFQSLLLFAIVVVLAIGNPWSALFGAAALVLIPSYFPSSTVAVYLQLAFGIAGIAYVYTLRAPVGLPHSVTRRVDAWFGGGSRKDSRRRPTKPAGAASAMARASGEVVLSSGLEVEDLVIRYGSAVAVNGLSLSAPLEKITGLIGPNGAGKTTTFNACSGLLRPSAGSVRLGEKDISRLTGPQRALHGLGRTFQTPQLFDSRTVEENVAMGREAYLVGRRPIRQISSGRRERMEVAAATEDAMKLVGIEHLRGAQAASLTVGQRRLVELARCIAAPFKVLLLDEPSAGLDRVETARFGALLKLLVSERGVGILLVEHDMELVQSVCDYTYVLDFGQLIFEGPTRELTTSEVVRAAYLGDALPAPA